MDYGFYRPKYGTRRKPKVSQRITLGEIYQSQRMEQYEKKVAKKKFLHLSSIFVN